MRPSNVPTVVVLVAGSLLFPASIAQGAADETRVFVEGGKPLAVRELGGEWKRGAGYLEQRGTGKLLYGDRALGAGDFRVRVRLSIETLEHAAASFVLGETSHFGFDGGDQRLFAQGPLFGPTEHLPESTRPIEPGKPFDLEVSRAGAEVVFRIDGEEVYRKGVGTQPLGLVGLRPWRATLRVYDFSALGSLQEPPAMPKAPKAYTIPSVDISGETARHRIVAAGTREIYQGHPHTLLMPNQRTMFCVWTLEHGGFCGPMKRSTDGGNTWSEPLDVPPNWRSVRNCPTIHRLVDPEEKARLFVFAGNGALYQSVSEDEGKTWTPMRENGLETVVAPMSVLPVEGGRKYLMWVQRREPIGDGTRLTVWQAASTDGGLTWDDFREIVDVPGADPCEPGVIPSPDGKQLLILMRENRRRLNSLYATSDDEGKTWSEARELSASLTGDRHAPRYAPDGRLVIAFRDQAAESPTKGHFVAWVGRYEDIVEGREGQYRVKLLHQHGRPGDCGYPGLDLLPDGTLVATTYVDYEPGPERNSVVSVRFRLEETDAKLAEVERS